MDSKIKDPSLESAYSEDELAWQRYTMPVTTHFCENLKNRDFSGKKLAYWMHITPNILPMLLALKDCGAEIAVGACNANSTDDAVAAYLVKRGIHVLGWRGMSDADYADNLQQMRAFEADYLCVGGGELSEAYMDKNPPIVGALEATRSGLNRLQIHRMPFPVFDWNSIPLKDRIENRFEVADRLWPVFCQVTGLSLFGRRILVVGYGPVGKGIAERARRLGASVFVAELDPVRQLESRFHGCEAVGLTEGIKRCEIVVTATGRERVIKGDDLSKARPGAIFCNAGHFDREIDIDWLYLHPYRSMKQNIERIDLDDTHLYLLCRGSLLNLASGIPSHGNDLFDHFTAVMLLGIVWMFDGLPDDIKPGLQPYPAHLEKKIARTSIEIAGKR